MIKIDNSNLYQSCFSSVLLLNDNDNWLQDCSARNEETCVTINEEKCETQYETVFEDECTAASGGAPECTIVQEEECSNVQEEICSQVQEQVFILYDSGENHLYIYQ